MKISVDLNGFGSEAASSKKNTQANKIHDAARQFESLLIGEMLKSVRESSSSALDGEESAGDDSAMDMAQTQFADALAKNGGLGLSRMIEVSLAHQAGTQKE